MARLMACKKLRMGGTLCFASGPACPCLDIKAASAVGNTAVMPWPLSAPATTASGCCTQYTLQPSTGTARYSCTGSCKSATTSCALPS